MSIVLYIHGKGGTSLESEHYKPLFPASTVLGLDYKSSTPWEAEKEFPALFEKLISKHEKIILIANSIGAYFAMQAGIERFVEKAYFISPMVDLEGLILGMMQSLGIPRERTERKRRYRNTLWRAAFVGLSFLCQKSPGRLAGPDAYPLRGTRRPDAPGNDRILCTRTRRNADRQGTRRALVPHRGGDALP